MRRSRMKGIGKGAIRAADVSETYRDIQTTHRLIGCGTLPVREAAFRGRLGMLVVGVKYPSKLEINF
jgi:hypothetical protein